MTNVQTMDERVESKATENMNDLLDVYSLDSARGVARNWFDTTPANKPNTRRMWARVVQMLAEMHPDDLD